MKIIDTFFITILVKNFFRKYHRKNEIILGDEWYITHEKILNSRSELILKVFIHHKTLHIHFLFT